MNLPEVIHRLENNGTRIVGYGVVRLAVFGSYAKGNNDAHSDLDVLVEFSPQAERYSNYLSLCALIERIFPELKVDVVTRNGLSPHIGSNILNSAHYVDIAA